MSIFYVNDKRKGSSNQLFFLDDVRAYLDGKPINEFTITLAGRPKSNLIFDVSKQGESLRLIVLEQNRIGAIVDEEIFTLDDLIKKLGEME